MAVAMNASDIASRWANNLGASTSRITAGVNAVTVAPGQAAARQKAVWVQNVAAAQDKWASRVASVPLSDWQQATVNKGIPRIASGAQAATPKFESFMTKLIPFINSGLGSLPARGNLDQNIARSTAWIRHMATFSNK